PGGDIREIALLHLRRRHDSLVDDAVSIALALVVHKKEGLVLADRTADIRAEEVEPHLRLDAADGWCPAVRVEIIVPEELPARAMELVGPSFDAYIDHGSSAPAVLRRIAVAQHAELLYGIHRRPDHIHTFATEAGGIGVVVSAVEQVVILQRAIPVDADRAT